MTLPNIIYKLADGRLWDVRNACWLTEETVEQLPEEAMDALERGELEMGPEIPVIDLVSASGESDEAYLLRTLQFYHFPTGALSLNTIPALKYGLAQLDAEYLTPRTLAGIAENDPEALARWQEHEMKAEPLRVKIRELAAQVAE